MNRIKIVKAKDFDWEAFKRREFFIIVRSRKSAVKILRFLSDQGYIWGWSETSMLEDIRMKEELLERAETNQVYICAGGAVPNGVLIDCSHSLYNRETVEIDFEEQSTNSKIVITNDGKTTTATLYSNGKKAGIGTAICHDDDEFDIYTGSTLALLRLEKSEKETEMTDWEKFVKGEVDMRVPKKYIRNFLSRSEKDSLTFKGMMSDWYLRWLGQDGDSIVVSVNRKIEKIPVLTEVFRDDTSKTINYIPGMK